MSYSAIRNISIIVIMLSLVVGGYIWHTEKIHTENKQVDDIYEQYTILNKTEGRYLNELGNLMVSIYSENRSNQLSSLRKKAEVYMTEECASLMVSEERLNKEVDKAKCRVVKSSFAYGKHQEDGIDKVLIHLELNSSNNTRLINLELKLNEDNKIDSIVVW